MHRVIRKHFAATIVFCVLVICAAGCFCRDKERGNYLPPQFVEVPGGSFLMGDDSRGRSSPAHAVTLSSFMISRVEITSSQFADFLNDIKYYTNAPVRSGILGGKYIKGSWFRERIPLQSSSAPGVFLVESRKTNPRRGGQYFVPLKCREDEPANWVTFYGAEAYCRWLSRKIGRNCRLPTEAEWEYAAKTRQAELMGLDGSVWEWCSDWYGPYSPLAVTNPIGPAQPEDATSPKKVIRGGSWVSAPSKGGAFNFDSPAEKAKSSSRAAEILMGYDEADTGFRVVYDLE